MARTLAEKREDRVIERIYGDYCSGMQIAMSRIPALFALARTALRAGERSDEIGARMADFIKQGEPVR